MRARRWVWFATTAAATHIDIMLCYQEYACMRTTVDIHDSLDETLRRRAEELGLTYKEAINRALAAGIEVLTAAPKRKPYRVRAKAHGFRAGVDVSHLNRLVDELEDEERHNGGA